MKDEKEVHLEKVRKEGAEVAGNKLAWRPAQYGRSEGPGLFVQAERLRLGPRLGPGRRAGGRGRGKGGPGWLLVHVLYAPGAGSAPRSSRSVALGRSLGGCLGGSVGAPSVRRAGECRGWLFSSLLFVVVVRSAGRRVFIESSAGPCVGPCCCVALCCAALRGAKRGEQSGLDLDASSAHRHTHSHSAAGRGDRSPEIQSVVVRDLGSLVKQSKRARTRSRKRVKLSEGRNRIVLGRALCGVGGFIAIEQAHLRGRVSETGIGDDVVLLAQS